MTDLLFVYITCKDEKEAEKIGEYLLQKKVAACINIFPSMKSMYFWPPGSGKLIKEQEVVLIAKSDEKRYKQLEEEVLRVHSYKNPCIMAFSVSQVSKKYSDWLKGEMK